MFCVVGEALLVQETISGAVLFFFVFDILFVREIVNQEIFVFDVLLVRETVDQAIFVFDHQQRFCVRHFCSFEKQSTKIFCVVRDRFINSRNNQQRCLCRRMMFLLIQETFDKGIFLSRYTTVTCCDFDGASICDSSTGLCLAGPRPDLGLGGCWKSAVGASLTARQAVRDWVKEYYRATPHVTAAQRPT